MSDAFNVADPVPPSIMSGENLLDALNDVKREWLGGKAWLFTQQQLRYFSFPDKNRQHYEAFSIPKKSGDTREILAPSKMLRSLLKTVSLLLGKYYSPPDCVTGFIPGKSVMDNARGHVGKRFVLNADLKDFFPNITRLMVRSSLRSAPFHFGSDAAGTLAGICCTRLATGRTGLPQGSPASPIVANIVCRALDKRLDGLARSFSVTYTRYADDITFSSDQPVFGEDGAFMRKFREIVSSTGFTLNEKKLRLQARGRRQEVTGLLVTEKVNVAKSYIRDLSSLLYIWERYGPDAAYACFLKKRQINPFRAHLVSTVRGRLSYLRMVKGADDPVWKKLYARFLPLEKAYFERKLPGDGYQYWHSWTIDRFERMSGARMEYDMTGNGYRFFICKGGVRDRLAVSKYCRTRLEGILRSGDEMALLAFKKKYRIGLFAPMIKVGPNDPDPDFMASLVQAVERSRKQTFKYCMGGWIVFRSVPQGKYYRPPYMNPETQSFSFSDPESLLWLKDVVGEEF